MSNQYNQYNQRSVRQRGPLSKIAGCGCLFLTLAAIAAPFIGLALTTGRAHMIFTYIAIGIAVLFALLILLAMLFTRRGREALGEGCAEGCLEAILSFLGG